MAETSGVGRRHEELLEVIREVRARWRTRLLLRGGLVIVGGALLALLLASLGLQTLKFSPGAIIGFRVGLLLVFAGLVALWFVRPMRRRVTDMQVALFVEEHEPSLQAAILSAVEVGATGRIGDQEVHPVIVERLVEQGIEKCRALKADHTVGRRDIRRASIALVAVSAAAVMLLVVGPQFLRQGASALLVLTTSAAEASPYAIQVTPGNATVPKGSDQMIAATLSGFRSNDVVLMVKKDGDGQFERMPLVATGDASKFEGMLFGVSKGIQYYVDSDGVKSPTYSMKVVALPAVDSLELEYVFPAYTGLPPQKVEHGGDVAALRGTEVRVRVKPTMATPAGRLQIEPAATSELKNESDGGLTGSFKIGQDGFYHVELDGPNGEHVAASPKYTIDAIEDQPPTVSFERPRRDVQANPVEEVFLQARAEDDFGVKDLDLVYSVNGGPEKTVSLYGRGAKALKEVSAGHTVYLEELGVKPGDFVAYYAKAEDNDAVRGAQSSTSDIYFIRVRSLDRSFREAQSMGGGGGRGGGGGGNQAAGLAAQQKEIISATHNVERDRPKTAADKFKENTVAIGLSQAKLREQVQELVDQMQQRLSMSDNIRKIGEVLPKAIDQMKSAEKALQAQQTKEAMPPEYRALQVLQQAEEMYDLEVRRQTGGGGGGGGGGQQLAEDLADLFQLQADRMANQYEQQQSASQQNAQQQIDALADKLKELARRQLQQAEQQRRAGQQAQSGGTGSGQRALADEVEQMARQLEQLRRDSERQGQQRQDLADAQRNLQNAADAMRRAAANGAQDGGAAAQQAAQLLDRTQRMLQQNTAQRATQDARAAAQQAQELARQQREIASEVGRLDQAGSASDRVNRMQQLGDRKDQLRQGVTGLQESLNQLSNQAMAGNQRDAARKLQEAAGAISGGQIPQEIEWSKRQMAGGSEAARPVENDLNNKMDALARQVADAATASDRAQQGNGLSQAANRLTDSVRTLSSMNEQMNQALGQRGQAGQQGQNGQQGPARSAGPDRAAGPARTGSGSGTRSTGPTGPAASRDSKARDRTAAGPRPGQQGQKASKARAGPGTRPGTRPGTGPGTRPGTGPGTRSGPRPEAKAKARTP